MGSLGVQELLMFLPVIGFCGIICFCVWKFYQMLSRINDNLAAIRHATERNTPDRPTSL
jgi:hypothetical protein